MNGKSYEVTEGTSLAGFMAGTGLPQQGLAVAIDYEVIPHEQWEQTLLKDKQEILLIRAVSGG